MNITGIIVGLATLVIIGALHPVVIKAEYYIGKKIWPLFLALGIVSCAASLFVRSGILSPILAVLGFTLIWCIMELFRQEERVKKGWAPANPKRR